MKFHTFSVKLTDLVNCILNAIGLISPTIARHHNRVAYISMRICEGLGLSEEERAATVLAADMHDLGALALEESINDLRFEDDYIHDHSFAGAHFLEHFPPFRNLAPLIRYHHQRWQTAMQQPAKREQVPLGSYIIHLADRAAVAIDEHENVLAQRQRVIDYVKKERGMEFHPECVDAFLEKAQPEYFWMDIASQLTEIAGERPCREKIIELDGEDVLSWAKFLSRLVDFRSPLNANHSSGVAASAAALAGLARFSRRECRMMLIAGYLHDIGKLSVPTAILEKNGPLDTYERAVINGHTYYTYRILDHVKEFDTLARWAAFHHERLDGCGYPFRITGVDLPLGSQIMAVADIFTALKEDRPYRQALGKREVLETMGKMAQDGAINGDLLLLLKENYELVNRARCDRQVRSAGEYAAMNPYFSRKMQRPARAFSGKRP